MPIFLLLILTSFSTCQLHNGAANQQLPTVVLTGGPRLIARRIWRGMEMNEVMQNVQAREPYHFHPVVVQHRNNELPGRAVTVYRKILRPAKLFYTGNDVVTHQWVGGDDNNERRMFFRMPAEGIRRHL
ncbi:hypothetical protein V3C99_006596 [Haemonchus contortus]|uniref:YkuD domain-containing protein n=1 Tax=Haemonchus contortus TaxID=6289 RepID=A0A7I4YQB7_HAECO